MFEFTTGLVLDGITLALREEFPASRIDASPIEQSLTPPAFIVLLVTSSQTGQANRRWKRNTCFQVCYFPQKGRDECYHVADTLMSCLELITLANGATIRGVDLRFEILDEVLHFFVSYNRLLYREKDETPMETLEIIQEG